MARKIWTALLSFAFCFCFTHPAWASSNATLTFGEDGITETVAGSGYAIQGTELTISKAGVYELTGSCANGSIVVGGSLDNVTLVLGDLSLTATDTAPIVIKKSSNVTIHLEGSSTLTDAEDASTEETNSSFEGAAIKVKSGSAVTFCGDGTLTVNGSAKNGIKGAATSSLTFLQGTYNVSSANNGIAADGSILISGGSYTITGDNDGIKSVPEADDADSAGNITITGGSFDIDVDGDGIQAEHELSISGGTFAIKTLDGYQGASFDKDTMSCKGLKASGDREDVENIITVTGGSFVLDTADDAVHSDEYLTVTGGSFDINTGDDGMHADTSLILGTEGGTVDRDPYVVVTNSYEGLEAGTVYVYSGSYNVTSSDDGINAAGGSSDGANPGGGGDNFNPGGGRPGGGGFPGGNMRPFADEETEGASLDAQAASDYCIYLYGGNVYVNAYGDGLDSNGNIVLNGGNIEVWGASAGDTSPSTATAR
ncbi:MAG: carbohydrate-binding domain-containing protein [Atopobiaceae bacterium]|nr:carbohydrate-binding domain-containing protein [Atopobiaceae bacterium]